jgi:hypothetical protein
MGDATSAGNPLRQWPGSGELARIAKAHVAGLFEQLGFSSEPSPGAVDLRPFARFLAVSVAPRGRVSPVQPRGSLFTRYNTLFGEAQAEISAPGFQRRFALAHELAHRIADLYLETKYRESWRAEDFWRFTNHAASYLLIPDFTLRALPGEDWDEHFSIAWLESTHRKLRVPIACLLKRLDEAEREGALAVQNCAALIVADVSAKQRTNYAPRVLVSCVPRVWYLPSNKRLASLGAAHLPRLFWSAAPFTERTAEDEIALLAKNGWRPLSLQCSFRYKIYESGPQSSRVMLAVFSPHPSGQ